MTGRKARLAVAALAVAAASMASATSASAVNCAAQDFKTLKMEENLRASEILAQCGHAGGRRQSARALAASPANPLEVQANTLGGTDVNTIPSGDTVSKNSQSGSAVAVNGNDVVVVYNDSRDAPSVYSGVSVSHDGGATFTRLGPSSPLTGHSSNFGEPIAVYDRKLGKFFVGDLVTGCGSSGIGLWTSTNGDMWTLGACAHTNTADDHPTMAVDNNPSSATYGRIYISFNDFNVSGGAPRVTHSDDGVTWSPPVTLAASFLRNASVAVAPDGSQSTVFVSALNEGGGGCCAATEQNSTFRSTDGGVTWNSPAQALIPGTFTIPGDSTCSNKAYFAKVSPNWETTGWGVNAVAPGGNVLYDYAAHGAGPDPSDVYVVRSTDNGVTWQPPVKLNTDATARAQWLPSLAVAGNGAIVATWYDRRNTATDAYERFARVSTDGGATWGPDEPISDVQIPQALNDSSFGTPCFLVPTNSPGATGNGVIDAWTDGRVAISGTQQEDVFTDRITTLGPAATTGDTTGVGVHTATLNGQANDNSKAGTAHFEYGTSSSYGQSTPGVSLPASASDQPVSAAISGLAPNTTYHYRLDAHNPDGDDHGNDRIFTTLPLGHHRITIVEAGIGAGSVKSADGAINCGAICTHVYEDETKLTLRAKPGPGSMFTGWKGGGCKGRKPCRLSVSADAQIRATFRPSNAFTIGKPVLNQRNGSAVLPLVLPSDGKLSLKGAGIKPVKAQRVAAKRVRAGSVNLAVKPIGKVERKLHGHGRATVKPKITFKPTGGIARTKVKKLTLKLRR